MRKNHYFPDNVVCVPTNDEERRNHFDLLKISQLLADPRIWVGHYQYEDIDYSADSNGGIAFSKICKDGETMHAYSARSQHRHKPARPTASQSDIIMSPFYISDRERRSKDKARGDIESCRKKSRYSKLEKPVMQQHSDNFDSTVDAEEEEVMLEKETKGPGRPKGSYNEPLDEFFIGSSELLLCMISKVELHAKSCKGQIVEEASRTKV